MIQSLSGRQKQSALRKKRLVMILFFALLLLSWTFIRPVFLTALDPFISLYFKTATSLYNTKEKTVAYFRTKEDSLLYIKQLEDENSRLHNKLGLFENNACIPVRQGNPIIVTSTSTNMTSTLESIKIPDESPSLDDCHRENADLETKNLISLKASPLLSAMSFLYDTVRLNKGERDGIIEGDIVYTRGMIVIGKILSVTKSSSLALLYSRDGIETYGTEQKTRTSFKVTGNGAGSYVALIPREVNIEENDKILLTEDQDFILGTVASVTFDKQDVSKKVYIRGGFNPASLSLFYINKHE